MKFSFRPIRCGAFGLALSLSACHTALEKRKNSYQADKQGIFSPSIAQIQSDNETIQEEADHLFNRGVEQAKTSEFPLAFTNWEAALRLYREIVISPLINAQQQAFTQGKIADTLENLGNGRHSLGQYVEAIAYYQQGLLIRQRLGDLSGKARVLGLLAISYGALGEYDRAIDYPQQALTISRNIGDRHGEATALSNLGEGYHALGRYDQAIVFQRQSLAVLEGIKPQSEAVKGAIAQSIGYLGDIHYSLGQYGKALDYHRRSLDLMQQLGNQRQVANALGQLGKTYHALADYGQAIEYHRQSITIHRELGNRWGEGKALNNLGLAYLFLGEYEKAITYHREALEITRDIGARQGESHSLNNLGAAFAGLGDYEQAIDLQQKSLVIAREIGDRLEEGITLSYLGDSYNRLQKYDEAERVLYEAIDVYESLRKRLQADEQKISIFDTQANAYQHLQVALIAQSKFHQALIVAERGRARAFVELLAVRTAYRGNPQTIEPLTFTEIQQVAREQQATLVEYSVLPDLKRIYVWIVSPEGALQFQSIVLNSTDTSLEELVSVSRNQIGVRGRDSRGLALATEVNVNADDKLQQLYRLLIEPITSFLPKSPSEQIIFIPQGPLFLAPFPALIDGDGNALINKHTVLTTPAIQVLQLTHQTQQNRSRKDRDKSAQQSPQKHFFNLKNPLIIGNPVMPKVGIPPRQLSNLPGAEVEAKKIADLLGARALIGAEATKQRVLNQLADAQLIHIATHGLLDNFGYDTPGAIALAPTREDDGLLTAGEIIDLEIEANLVVLSACNTGQGDIRGDGVVGLSRSLLTAGSTSVIVSLWAVPDEPTAVLMEEFYRLLGRGFDKPQALRQAMLRTKANYPDPINWAAFTLIGES